MIEGLYLHIPFCVSRCSYCDFTTSACSDEARMDAYVETMVLQLRRAAKGGMLGDVKTIYIGGGTPSHLGSKKLNSLVYAISLSVNLENVVEFTCEINPESIDDRMVADLFSLGVDRFSIGAQSFDDAVLAGYGRVHDAAAIERAVAAVHTRTDNVSLDLICGGPGQDETSWEASLRRAVDLGVPHVSVYPLMLEEGTPLARCVESGACTIADEDLQTDMMLAARDILEDAGLWRYEVASYAKPGFESKHNLSYWDGSEYLGLGSGASGMLSGENAARAIDIGLLLAQDVDASRVRYSVGADDRSYVSSMGKPSVDIELLSAYDAQVEDLMLGMRRSVGVSQQAVDNVDGAPVVFDDLVSRGLVRFDAGRFIPTDRGWLLGNEVYGAIWGLAV